jgi:hypothetical protein
MLASRRGGGFSEPDRSSPGVRPARGRALGFWAHPANGASSLGRHQWNFGAAQQVRELAGT